MKTKSNNNEKKKREKKKRKKKKVCKQTNNINKCLESYNVSMTINSFAAREFVLLMCLQRQVPQKDSAIPKRSFCSALVLLSVHEKPEIQQVVL